MTIDPFGDDSEPDIDDDWDWDTELGLLEPEPDLRPRPWVAPEPYSTPEPVHDLQPAVLDAGDVGDFLRACRAVAGMSQRDLAARVGVPQSTVSRAEARGGTDLLVSTLCRLVEGCGISLVGVTGPEAEPVQADLEQRHRDTAGRALPAHVVNWPVTGRHGAWWGDDRYTLRRPRPRRTYSRRTSCAPRGEGDRDGGSSDGGSSDGGSSDGGSSDGRAEDEPGEIRTR